MSHSVARSRKAGGEARPRGTGKAAGDAIVAAPSPPPPVRHHSSHNKNKIPKSLRYELDNALVGLCDVWFEDIKPHLVRNNIKLHVEGASCADQTLALTNQVPGCSHLQPADSPSCHLCRLLCNAANSIESAVSQAAAVSPVLSASPNADTPNQSSDSHSSN